MLFDLLIKTVAYIAVLWASNLVIRNQRKRQCNQDNRGIISS